jgi:hypothetical protein
MNQMRRIAVLAFLALAACGADGAPTAPADGLSMSGSAAMGVARNGG